MRSVSTAATVTAAAFAGSVTAFLLSAWLPWLEATSRAFVVGSGSLLAAFTVVGLNAALQDQVYGAQKDARPLVSMHPGMRRP